MLFIKVNEKSQITKKSKKERNYMDYHRFHSIMGGIILGVVVGPLAYAFVGYFLACGNIDGFFVPEPVRSEFTSDVFTYSFVPGAIVGLILGIFSPKNLPRGTFSYRIGTFSWLIESIVAWITQWETAKEMSGFKIAGMVLVMIVSFIIIALMSMSIGKRIETVRESYRD